MEVILDESSLVPCAQQSAVDRIAALALTIASLDRMGLPRQLRAVKDAAHRDIEDGRGLAAWCGDKRLAGRSRDAVRLVARRLSKQPYIDGVGGLLHRAQSDFAVEARFAGEPVLGLAVAALNDGVGLGLGSAARPKGGTASVSLHLLNDDDDDHSEDVSVIYVISSDDTEALRDQITEKLDASFRSGQDLLEGAEDLFQQLRFGPDARNQIGALTGREHYFPQLVRHLRALNQSVKVWRSGEFVPRGVTSSVEAQTTLNHGRYGPLRDFPVPAGFTQRRWSLHTKLMGANMRLYYRFEGSGEHGAVVLLGYFGAHLPTVKYPT